MVCMLRSMSACRYGARKKARTGSPVGDDVLQVVVHGGAVPGRAVLAAEEAAVVRLVLTPALLQ